MGATGTSTRRVIAVITLMVLAAWALRGYLPGVERTAEEVVQRRSNPLALAAVIVLLCAAVAIIGFAIIVRMRDKRPLPAQAGSLPASARPGERPSWRFTVVALAVLIGLVLLVALLSRLSLPVPIEDVPPDAAPDAPASGAGVADDPGEPRPIEDDPADGNVVNYLIPPMLLLMALIVVGTAIASRRQGHRPTSAAAVEVADEPATAPATATSLARAAEVGLAEIGDLSREPREAIIACYAAMERELTRVPGAVPQACDTPTEVLARAVATGALRSDSATELVDLFEEARFSPHVMSEQHRDAAVQVLSRVLTELPQRTSGVPS
ncbi:hypothetical protein AU197_04850 [Mycobacterium sp. IS-1590]|uniref:DUF4129 domain-containing protein n=1 Tax=Mycobacterium sp. IS-1590 TaxID=1772286 RepID=UPI00074999E2|nr:DUF4129 domain-containing protein [Mycobacterium sp. IS-1590]KUI43390.1 hypothetical protein AU197_04850 [Mycobacterium sp. IS-1590]